MQAVSDIMEVLFIFSRGRGRIDFVTLKTARRRSDGLVVLFYAVAGAPHFVSVGRHEGGRQEPAPIRPGNRRGRHFPLRFKCLPKFLNQIILLIFIIFS